MNNGLMIGLGIAGVAVAGGVGYMVYSKRKVTTLPSTPSPDPNRVMPSAPPQPQPTGARVLWTAPDGSIKTYYCFGPKTSSADMPGLQSAMVAVWGSEDAAARGAQILVASEGDTAWHSASKVFGMLPPPSAALKTAPIAPPLPGYLSAYTTPAGDPLFRRPDGMLVKLSGIAFGTGPDNLVKNPQGQLVYLKDGAERNPAYDGFMVAPAAPPPDADLASALASAQAKLAEARRKAEEEAKALLNKKLEIRFSGNRWSGPGRDYMGNHR